MKRLYGGNKVSQGYYMNVKTAEFVIPDEESQVLPGTGQNTFIKVPSWLPVIAGPAFGLVFVILLPLAGIAGLFGFLAYKAGFASTNVGKVILSPLLNGLRQGQVETPQQPAKGK
jgi:hypothetical protein